jgi:hypothetical protein
VKTWIRLHQLDRPAYRVISARVFSNGEAFVSSVSGRSTDRTFVGPDAEKRAKADADQESETQHRGGLCSLTTCTPWRQTEDP